MTRARTNGRAISMALVAGGWLALSASACEGCAGDGDVQAPPSSATGGAAAAAGAGGQAGAGGGGAAPAIYLQLGPNLPPAVAARVVEHLEAAATLPVVTLDAAGALDVVTPGSLVLGFGETTATRSLVTAAEVDALEEEGFVLRSGEIAGARALVTDGRDLTGEPNGEGDLGAAYGSYALLEELGFAFLHPLAAHRPAAVGLDFAEVDRTESPRWPIRGMQIHTMHPLELTELLQGWGPGDPNDQAGWSAMLPEWDSALEWLVANRQNRVHWVLLWAEPWAAFADGSERIARLGELVEHGHDFGIAIGIDAPLRLQQQHSFRLIREAGELAAEVAQIEQQVDYLMQAGFDYLCTESGSTEFTATDDERMLAWMDALASYLDEAYGRECFIKVHASTGQTVEHYVDPDTGDPLNFNFLPHYADPRVGVMPHTVQHYALDDPAPTYGNSDFGYMREFLQEEVGRRRVVWHPETAYWVSFDLDVPLFLPVYALRRVRDLRLLAADEEGGQMGRDEHAGGRMDGQLTFSSGWEWGYWLQEVVTARAAWQPPTDAADDATALAELLDPVVRPFGGAAAEVRDALVGLAVAELELLIEGRVGGVAPSSIERRSGQAYLQGFETWDDVSDQAEGLPGIHLTRTQPDRLGLVELRNPLHAPPDYDEEIEPLLAEMEATFIAAADTFDALRPSVPAQALALYDDLVGATRVTALRARQIHGLYDYVGGFWTEPEAWRAERLADARAALDEALVVVQEREAHYRVPADRIAGWRPNPTAYDFSYLWTARTLFFWWRDEGKAVESPVSPCYLNHINPAKVGLGEGTLSDATDVVTELFANTPGLGSITDCLGAPASEPVMPPPGLRD